MAKRKKAKRVKMPSPENYIRQRARKLPIYECWVNKDWKEDGLANLTIARKHTNGNFTIGIYLVDLKCLGIKDAHAIFNLYPQEYQEILEQHKLRFDIENIEYILAHNIIYAGIEYADDYGFKPHKDFGLAKYIIEEDTEDIELIEIDCGGLDGKPFYIRGPLDSDVRAAQIIAQLEKTAGPGNFDYIYGEPEDMDNDIFMDNPDDEHSLEISEDELQKSKTFQFKVQIEGISDPPVWRRVTLPSYFTFLDFHYIIQNAFGWENAHLFQFSDNGFGSDTVITEIHGDFDTDIDRQIEAAEIKLSEVFSATKKSQIYIYDFGDSWEHKVTLEKVIDDIADNATCIEGKGKCPPEDCGGIGGFAYLKEILADKSHPEHDEYRDWLGLEEGEIWDPNEFDLTKVNDML